MPLLAKRQGEALSSGNASFQGKRLGLREALPRQDFGYSSRIYAKSRRKDMLRLAKGSSTPDFYRIFEGKSLRDWP
jgi:hypothetical protein